MTSAPRAKPPKDSDVVQLTLRRHKWRDDGFRARTVTASGCDEHERVCDLCGMVRITIHVPQGYPYRAWRTAGGIRFADPGYTPMCDGEGK